MKRTPFLLLSLCLISLFAAAQGVEICNDGIDNDGDGFIDCYDGSCANIGTCDGTFLGNDAKCEAKPAAFPKFTMTLDFASPDETTNHLSRMAIGDVDRDGIPEIITMNRYTKKVYVISGRDGSIKKTLDAPFTPQWEIAIANIDNDNCAEIFTFGNEGRNMFLYSYNCDLTTQLWKTQISGDPINFGLADFNGDGKVELYAKDEIYDAKTGTRLIKSNNWKDLNGGPVAVDIEGDANLELVVGGYIYSVNLGNGSLDNGSLTETKKIPDYYIRFEYNATSVADYNLDGFLDVLASGSTEGKGKNTTVFFWDVQNNVVKTFFDNTAGAYLPNGWENGTGRINIADLDGNGKMNASYVSGKFLYALDEELNLMWRKVINEETSGHTGCTLFDFNGDGKSEIVYRDEQFLYIINGTDGSIYNQQNCVSRTNREYPIVADVDADGSTEMCVPCGFSDTKAKEEFDDLEYSRYSHVRVYKSAAEPWVPARRVWNQHGYFNVNVNDDLTIPKRQQKHHLVFSTGSCTTGPNRPLNGFLNQSPFLNSLGCPTYASPDLAYVDNSLTVNPPTCPDGKFTVSFQITNKGDQVLDGTVPITFYNGSPSATGAVKLGTISVNLTQFGPNDIFSITDAEVNGPGSPFTLFIVLNDNGSTVPTPISLPNTNFVECDYSNNIISAPVRPRPVKITALKVSDNAKCPGSATPDNGAVRAFIPKAGGGENTTDYTFFWFRGAVDATPDFTGAVYSGIAAGTYSVFARHKTAQCNSDTAQVDVGLYTGPLKVTIIPLASVTDCKNPNGSLKAVADSNGQPASAFTFAWYQGNDIFTSPQIGVSDVATNLKAQTYTVLVTEKLSGCQTVESRAVPSTVAPPDVVATKTDIICSASNSGKASATADGGTSGFKFEWYKGTAVKPAADFTGASLTNLAPGTYTVIATNNSSKCVSTPETITIVQTAAATVTATKTSDMTSCDPGRPNGAANASVTGGPAGFSFEWFKGTVLTNPNKIGSASAITSLAAGTYTVRATENTSGCAATATVVIGFNVPNPTLANAVQHVTTCTPYNGQVTITPSIDTPADFTYSWYDGTTVDGSPDYTDDDNILSDLGPGDYTVSAVHKTKFCNAPPITVTVLDNSPTVTITLNSLATKLPSDCNAANGEMEVDVAAPGNTLGFKIEWHFGRAPFSGPVLKTDNGTSESLLTGLRTGVYSVTATDLNSGCSKTAEFDLPFADAHELQIVSTDDVQTCVPGNDGSAVIKLIKSPLPGFDEADYDIFLYNGMNDPGPGGTSIDLITGVSGQLNYNTSTPLAVGFYTAVAVSKNPLMAACRSVPKLISIKKATVDPVIVPTAINANRNCAGVGTGSITVSANGGNPADYTFEWFQGVGTTGASIPGTGVNGEQVVNLGEGFFTVRVTNNTATSTGCKSLSAIPVGSNPMNIDIAGSGLATNNLTSCDAISGMAISNGSATVSAITQDGAPGNLADYIFEWSNSGGTVLQNSASATLTSLGAGTYFVKATNNTNSCFTNVQFVINDMTIGSVGVTLDSFDNPERCILPRNGRLKVVATGTSGGGYGFEWFNGATPTGGVASTSDELQNISVPGGQTDVQRTIRVTNVTNNCKIVDVYTVPLTVNEVQATTSASPLTNCLADDGSVFGAVTNDVALDYTYNWYNGVTVKASADHAGQLVNNLPAGQYTMVAVDNVDNFCASLPQTVLVTDERMLPVVTTTIVSPVTNCDPAKANGGVSAAIANGDIVAFTFDWFNGGLPPAGASIFSGISMTGLPIGTYSVRGTNRITGCAGTASVVIIQQLEPIPAPQIVVVQNVTSCTLDNGILSASVNGNTADYIFNWYVGGSVRTSIDFHGERVDSLAVGNYTVTATSRLTGCTTGPDTDQIIKEQVFPDFEFKIIPASCEADNGFASLVMASNVPISTIEWNTDGAVVMGPNLENIGAGTYNVTVTSELGCEATKEVVVGTEIRPYNGVSRNGDGRNEIFNISCIENFPGNNVKIFNRAGTMVYEGEGYNNVDIYFDGKSNRGVSPMGIGLPDGTYYYVIDKRDGSKPLAGYLELVK
jgi:hypothetical protein